MYDLKSLKLMRGTPPSKYVGTNDIEVENVLIGFMGRYCDGYVAHRVSSAIEYLLRAPYKNGNEDIFKGLDNLLQVAIYLIENDIDVKNIEYFKNQNKQ